MKKSYCSLGLMSGTSGDGVDASIIQSDGDTKYEVILDQYFEYNKDIYENIHNLKDKINNLRDLNNLSKELTSLENKITLFHAQAVNKIIKDCKEKINFLGFHGQTIFHNYKEKISRQLGDGKLLSQLTKKTVIYNFRENDLKNGGHGAPLTPIFHKLIASQNKIRPPLCILNLGGIANVSIIKTYDHNDFISYDIGPGNCLIDKWIRTNTGKRYDRDGLVAQLGKNNKKIFSQLVRNSSNIKIQKRLSLDTNNFDLSCVKKISLEDGAATLTEFTVNFLTSSFSTLLKNINDKTYKILVCGGGRKNKFLMRRLKENLSKKTTLKLIDDYGVNGDFIESQAFAYLAIRSYLNLPISFPNTTGVEKPCVGGTIYKI